MSSPEPGTDRSSTTGIDETAKGSRRSQETALAIVSRFKEASSGWLGAGSAQLPASAPT